MSEQTVPDGCYGYPLSVDGQTVWVYVPAGLPLEEVAEAIWAFWGEER